MDPDLKLERRGQNRQVKLKALVIVTTLFVLALFVGQLYPQADKLIHLTILGYMGARVFLRGV